MRRKILIFTFLSILSTYLIGCSNASVSKNPNDGFAKETSTAESSLDTVIKQEINANNSNSPTEDEKKDDDIIIPTNTSEPFLGKLDLDSETEKFIYGTWKVEKLLGFANSWNDASEYPTGQKIIDDEIIINKDFFSSIGLENYEPYQYELQNPIYNITAICYNKDSFYRLYKIDLSSLNINDEVRAISVSSYSSGFSIPISFLVVNNDRLILMLEATVFELKKATD
ncbi:hypothetical protein [Anaerosporobacter sp.]|uniref:hypothetical protein n=1 Tax=Anaerosporobacter sp. TaxID=1872529 RepID=UPI00286EBE82|nr:hypothetical protein [Anaerosporobacter sp.]